MIGIANTVVAFAAPVVEVAHQVEVVRPAAEMVVVNNAVNFANIEVVEDFFVHPLVVDVPRIAPFIAIEENVQFFDCMDLCAFHGCAFESSCMILPGFETFHMCAGFRMMNGLPVLCKPETQKKTTVKVEAKKVVEEKKVEVVALPAPRVLVNEIYTPARFSAPTVYFGLHSVNVEAPVLRTVRHKALTLVAARRPAVEFVDFEIVEEKPEKVEYVIEKVEEPKVEKLAAVEVAEPKAEVVRFELPTIATVRAFPTFRRNVHTAFLTTKRVAVAPTAVRTFRYATRAAMPSRFFATRRANAVVGSTRRGVWTAARTLVSARPYATFAGARVMNASRRFVRPAAFVGTRFATRGFATRGVRTFAF